MRRRHYLLIAPALVLALSFSLAGGCSLLKRPSVTVTATQSQTPPMAAENFRRQLAIQIDRIAVGSHEALGVKRALLAQGKITKDQSLATSTVLLKIDQIAKQMDEQAADLDPADLQGKQALLNLVGELERAVQGVVSKGVITLSPRVQEIISLIGAAVAIIKPLLGGA